VDYTVNASVGFPLATGTEDTAGPVDHVLPAWDVACGLYAAIGEKGCILSQLFLPTQQAADASYLEDPSFL